MNSRKEIKDFRSLTGVQKVAVFLIAMGVDNSVPLLKQLPEYELEKVTVEIARMRNLPSEVVSRVVLDFYELMLADKYVTQGGITYAKKMLEHAFGMERARQLMKKVKAATEVSGFKLLQSINPHELLNYLQKEHPQTIA
ncbi:MAG: flagellar motor switch protein FliG, partial [Calditrichaeota bacterium]